MQPVLMHLGIRDEQILVRLHKDERLVEGVAAA